MVTQICVKWAKIRLKIRCFVIFFRFGPLVFLEIAQDSLEHCRTTNRVKTHGKHFGEPNRVRNYGFCHFIKVASLYLLDIAQDCSLGQCLTSSRAETSKKMFVAEIEAKIIISIQMLLSVHSNLLAVIIIIISIIIFSSSWYKIVKNTNKSQPSSRWNQFPCSFTHKKMQHMMYLQHSENYNLHLLNTQKTIQLKLYYK